MSESLSSELSLPYTEPLDEPPQNGSTNLQGGQIPVEVAERMPSSPNLHVPDNVMDPQPENRLSVVSAVSLEPRRRSRHHQSRHSHVLRDLAHMLSMTSRDANELRRGLNAAFDKLDQSRARASHAEKLALDMLLRVREAEEERTNAMREASTTREELGKHKALLDSAHGEIRRAQQLLQDQDNLRYEAEASAARARDNARQMKQRRLIELAREQGRRVGYNEGIQAGQRIGYYGGQDSADNEAVVLSNEGPRFREGFDESRYNLDDLDEPPPLRDIHPSSSYHLIAPSLTTLAARQVYHDSQDQRDEVANPADDATTLPPMASYTPVSLPGRVQRTVSMDSSSTTTLPAASAYVSSRAPPPLPTIPEVESTEVGSVSRARTPGGSLRGSSHILPVLAPPSPSGSGTVQPPPGSVEDIPSAGYTRGPAPIFAPSPRAGFNDTSIAIADDGMVPGVPRSPVQERFATPGRNQTPAREHFVATSRSPLQERLASIPSPRAIHVSELQGQGFRETASNRPVGSTPRRDGPPKRRPIPQMPASLAPMSHPNVPYSSGSRVTTRRRRPSESDNGIPRDASFNPNPNWPRPSSQVMPNSVGRPLMDAAPVRTQAMSPRNLGDQPLDRGASYTSYEPRPATNSQFAAGYSPVSQPEASRTLPPRVHVQIPPTRYHAPNSASPRVAESPAGYDPVTPTDLYPPGATSSSHNASASDLPHRSPRRYPPTLYNEPMLQQQHATIATYEQDDRASPVLPIPSRESRAASPRMIPPSSTLSRGNSYTARQRAATNSPRMAADVLPVPAPSMSPHPNPVALSRRTSSPQRAVTPSTPRRTASPNPLPRGASPAPLPRASSPAPLPVRSPSTRSVNVRRSPSDVSLHNSPYMHYNPTLEADIAVLATSAERLPTPT